VSAEREGTTGDRLITPVFLLATLSTLAYFIAIGTITPILPRFVEGPLSAQSIAVGLTIGAFSVSAVLLRPFVGRISDRRGRRILIVAGGSIVALAIAGYGLAHSLSVLLALRLLTGLGEAAFYVGVASVINDLAPDERRGEALSYFSLALFGGLAVGPIIGESVLGNAHFTAVWLVAGGSALAAALIGLLIPETRPDDAGKNDDAIINKAALMPGAVLATNIWGLATFSSFIPLYALKLGLSGSRFVFATNSAVILAIRLFGARLPDRWGPRKSARAALSCAGSGLLIIGAWHSVVGLFVGTAVYSIGHALAFPALMTLAIRSAPASERGSVVGTFTAFFDLSFGVGAISAGVIADLLGYRGAFVVAGLVALGGLVLLFTVARRARRGAGTTSVSERTAAPAIRR
jgi:MFS family permease